MLLVLLLLVLLASILLNKMKTMDETRTGQREIEKK